MYTKRIWFTYRNKHYLSCKCIIYWCKHIKLQKQSCE